MRVNIPISPGELFDRLSILEIKMAKISDDDKLKHIRFEHRELTKILIQSRDELKTTQMLESAAALANQLKQVNETIWDIEDDIRDCERRKDFGESFIKLARGVYVNNDKRSRLKRKINEILRSELVEEKSYTKYQ